MQTTEQLNNCLALPDSKQHPYWEHHFKDFFFQSSFDSLVKIYRILSKWVKSIHCSDILYVVQRNSHSNLKKIRHTNKLIVIACKPYVQCSQLNFQRPCMRRTVKQKTHQGLHWLQILDMGIVTVRKLYKCGIIISHIIASHNQILMVSLLHSGKTGLHCQRLFGFPQHEELTTIATSPLKNQFDSLQLTSEV